MTDEKSLAEDAGRIIRGVGGLYTVLLDSGETLLCPARGVFRHEKLTPLVGDRVRLKVEPDGSAAIDEIFPRKSFLLRPPAANLTHIFIVVAAAHPDPELLLTDKLISIAEHRGIEPVIVVTKADANEARAREIAQIYRSGGFSVFVTSSDESSPFASGASELYEFLRGGCRASCDVSKELDAADEVEAEAKLGAAEDIICAVAGVSGAGKSTLMNLMFPSLKLRTAEVSRKIERGRHTTREVELYRLSELMRSEGGEQPSGFFADTPGFSLIDLVNNDYFTKEELADTFREFRPYIVGKCRYTKCTHLREEGCAVLAAVGEGKISPARHDSYVAIYGEIKDKHPWDSKRACGGRTVGKGSSKRR